MLSLTRLKPQFGVLASNISLQLTFDSPLGLATPSPHIDSNAGMLRRWAPSDTLRRRLLR